VPDIGYRDFSRHWTPHAEHKRPHADALLAIPDAIAWCWAKGGHWRKLINPAVTVTRDV
jgi:hypothetical protein